MHYVRVILNNMKYVMYVMSSRWYFIHNISTYSLEENWCRTPQYLHHEHNFQSQFRYDCKRGGKCQNLNS